MGKIFLFTTPKVEPELPRFPTEDEIHHLGRETIAELQRVRELGREIDNSTREKVALLVSVLGLTDLATLCVSCALWEIAELTKRRSDVCAVLRAYYEEKTATARRKAG